MSSFTSTARAAPVTAKASNGQARKFNVTRGVTRNADASLMYGTGGVGKSTLAAGAPGPVLFIDLENGTQDLDVARVTPNEIASWSDLREFLHSDTAKSAATVVVDTSSAAEELCRQHVLRNVPGPRNTICKSLEDYGFGKGGTYLVEEWRNLLADLDAHRRAGRNVILIAHERVGKVPNPSGDDFIRYEPRLYSDRNASIMHVTKEWADHVLFVAYDVAASDGKAKGNGTRTIYTAETATHLAKSRRLPALPIVFSDPSGAELWNKLASVAPVTASAAPDL